MILPRAELILVAGKDPIEESGGHSSLVRATGYAASALGYQPQVFCISDHHEVVETNFGRVHRLSSPFRWAFPEQARKNLRSPYWALHMATMRNGIEHYIGRHHGTIIVHGFALWGCIGVQLAERARRPDTRFVTVTHAYTSIRHEVSAKRAGTKPSHGWRSRAQAAIEYHWMLGSSAHLETRALRGSDLLLVNYESVRELVLGLGAPPRRVRKVAYTADLSFRLNGECQSRDRSAAAPNAVPGIVAVSRHDPRKGLDVLLRALALLEQQGLKFHACLVGKGALLEAHRRLARELGLKQSTEIVGWVPDVGPYLEAADIFVLPSLEEGSGSIALIEATRYDLAIVSSGIDGMAEDLTHEATGLLVPPGNEQALAAAIARLLRDRGLREGLQAGSRRLYQERFSTATFEQDLGAVYQELEELEELVQVQDNRHLKLLLCLYVCEHDRDHLAALEHSELMRRIRADSRFQVVEVYADGQLPHPVLDNDRITLPCQESYTGLSIKTHQMITAALAFDFDFLLKLDVTIAGYSRKRHRKTAELMAKLTPDSVLEAMRDPCFFTEGYNGLVRQRATQQGFEAWMHTKGLDCDYRRVFPQGQPTPPYFLGKFYALNRGFCQFIAQRGQDMAVEHHRYLGGSEDLMIGRLYQRWIDSVT